MPEDSTAKRIALPLHFSNRDARLPEGALHIVRRLREEGYTAFYAGGCVRDALRGAPIKDIDIATSATPEEVKELFPAQSIGVGKAFGVMLVVLDGISYDVATFRKDGGYQDGRHPETITYDTAKHDAERRDFTINALFYDPVQETVIDFVGGLDDLKRGVLRTVGSAQQRFREDRLRLLRAIRFASVCKLKIERTTWEALKTEAPALMCVSMERIRTEFERMLCEAPDPARAMELLFESGLLGVFFPELTALRGCLQDPVWHPEGDVWEHVVRMLCLIPAPRDPQLVWSVLLHDIGKPATLQIGIKPDGSPAYRTPNHASVGAKMTPEILRRFKLPVATIEAVQQAVAGHMQFIEIPKMKQATLRRFLGRPTMPLELALHRLDCLSSHAKLDLYDFAQEQIKRFGSEPVLPKAFISGNDLMLCGYAEGIQLGKMLRTLYTMQLEGATRSDLLEHALLNAPKPRKLLFVCAPEMPFPLRKAWETLCERPEWDVAAMILPGQPWDEPPHPKRRILRLVADCAGNVEYPDISGFDAVVLPQNCAWEFDEPPILRV